MSHRSILQDIGKMFHNNILIIKNRLLYQQMNMSEFFIVLGKILVTHKYPSLWSKKRLIFKKWKKDVGNTSNIEGCRGHTNIYYF